MSEEAVFRPRAFFPGLLALLLVLLGAAIAAEAMPCVAIDVDGAFAQWILRDQFSTGGPLLWFVALLAGFVYVSRVGHGRKGPLLKGRYPHCGGYSDIVLTMLAGIPMFFACPVHTMHFGCAEGAFSWGSVAYNYGLWCGGFVIGLQHTYLYRPPLTTIILRPDYIRRWGVFEWTVVTAVLVLVGVVGAMMVMYLHNAGRLVGYIVFLCVTLVLVAAGAFISRRTHYVHVHHYIVWGYFALFTATNHALSAAVQGLLIAISLEGIGRWGWDALYRRRRTAKLGTRRRNQSRNKKARHAPGGPEVADSGSSGVDRRDAGSSSPHVLDSAPDTRTEPLMTRP